MAANEITVRTTTRVSTSNVFEIDAWLDYVVDENGRSLPSIYQSVVNTTPPALRQLNGVDVKEGDLILSYEGETVGELDTNGELTIDPDGDVVSRYTRGSTDNAYLMYAQTKVNGIDCENAGSATGMPGDVVVGCGDADDGINGGLSLDGGHALLEEADDPFGAGRIESVDDTLTFLITGNVKGRIHFVNFRVLMAYPGNSNVFEAEFRVSENGIFWDEWRPLTIENVETGEYVADGSIYIEVRWTRITESTPEQSVRGVVFSGTLEELKNEYPTLDGSIFADEVGTEELRLLTANLFKKLYFRGILPHYITRADNVDEREDSDFIDVFFSVARFFALLIRYFSRFERAWEDYDIMLENVREYGLYFDEGNVTLEELQYLSQHYYDEYRKRGTAMVFGHKGDDVNGQYLDVDGEMARLLRSGKTDELLYENVPLWGVGWCLGKSSPLYRGTCASTALNKTAEDTQDFVNLRDFYISSKFWDTSGNVQYEIESFEGRKVLCLKNTSGIHIEVGLGRIPGENKEMATKYMTTVDVAMDYEITFAFWTERRVEMYFGVEGFDNLGKKLDDAFIHPSGQEVREEFWDTTDATFKEGTWYYARGIIHAYSTENIPDSVTNLGFGTNLYFNNPFVKYIVPQIFVAGSQFNVKIWDYKIRPLIRGTNILPLKNGTENSRSLGFIESNRIFYVYARNNNNGQSLSDITDIIERYLLPYDTTNVFTFMTNYE